MFKIFREKVDFDSATRRFNTIFETTATVVDNKYRKDQLRKANELLDNAQSKEEVKYSILSIYLSQSNQFQKDNGFLKSGASSRIAINEGNETAKDDARIFALLGRLHAFIQAIYQRCLFNC